jgi:NAD(P)H dehydrogenase (quinone)
MSVVVTGATGHLGRLVVEHLLRRGVEPGSITATGRRVEVLDDLAERGVRVARADLDDPSTLPDAFAGADTLLLVSGSDVARRVPQHQAAVDAAVAAGVGRIVYTSAPHADTTRLAVAPTHKATEELVAASGLAWTFLRNNWYTENYVGTVLNAKDSGVIVTSAGEGRVASAARTDYAEAAAVVLTSEGHEGRAYELSGDVAWSFDELAEVASALVGRRIVHRAVTPNEHRRVLLRAKLPKAAAAFVVALDADIAAGALADTTTDLRDLTGRPTTPLADALRAALPPEALAPATPPARLTPPPAPAQPRA